MSQSLQYANGSLRAATACVLIALLVVSCGANSPGEVSTTTQPPRSQADLEALTTRVCADLSAGVLSYAAIVEDAIVQAADISFSALDLGEALTVECPGKAPATELLGTE